MRYSVYNYDRRQYDYYDGPGPKGTHAGSPKPARGRSQLGATPEQAAWRVPATARRVGSGTMPQGRVATLSAADPLGDLTSELSNPWVLGAIGVVLYYCYGRHK